MKKCSILSIHEGVSYPVGKVDLLDLYPLNFREFLYAMGEKGLADALKTKEYSIDFNDIDLIFNRLNNYFKFLARV